MNIALYDLVDSELDLVRVGYDMTVDEFRLYALMFSSHLEPHQGTFVVGWVDESEGDYIGVIPVGTCSSEPFEVLDEHLLIIESLVRGLRSLPLSQ